VIKLSSEESETAEKIISRNEKCGFILLVVGIPILCYLSFTLLMGTIISINDYQFLYINQYWDIINYYFFNFVLNIILLAVCIIGLIVPGKILIGKKKEIA
jgi:hypothetical protein